MELKCNKDRITIDLNRMMEISESEYKRSIEISKNRSDIKYFKDQESS